MVAAAWVLSAMPARASAPFKILFMVTPVGSYGRCMCSEWPTLSLHGRCVGALAYTGPLRHRHVRERTDPAARPTHAAVDERHARDRSRTLIFIRSRSRSRTGPRSEGVARHGRRGDH